MNRVVRIDVDNLEVEVEAGATWKKVYEDALSKGLLIGSYPSSAPAATIAGWISTGGIGVGSYKYGSVGANLRNMEVVLPEGQIIETGFDYVSDHSAGYNLNALFQGSEGTLGVVTKVTLKAVPAPEAIRPVAIRFGGLSEMYPLLHAVTRTRIEPLHISFADENHTGYLRKMGRDAPEGAVLMLVLEGSKEQVAIEDRTIDDLVTKHGGTRLPDDVAQHEWEESPYELRAREVGVSAALAEAVVPLTELPETLPEVYELIRGMKMEAAVLGMMGDRNTVLLMPYYMYNEKKMVKSMTVLSFGSKLGNIAMAHKGRPLGFGLFYAHNLKKVRGDGADLMFDIKTVVDPHDIMNPGKLLEGLTKFGFPLPGLVMDVGMGAMAGGKKLMSKDSSFEDNVEDFKEEKEAHGGHG
jgi:glycolate oxidase